MTSAFAQPFGSEHRKSYEKEVNGPHGECRTDWERVATGVDYRTITCLGDEDDLDLHVFRFSSQFWKFDVAYTPGGSSARRESDARDVPFVINANFFQRDRSPIGAVVGSGSLVRDSQKSTWQSIFLIDADGKPQIIPVSRWSKYRDRAQMAVQAGPRIVVDGHTNKVNKGYAAARAGVCIHKHGDVIFFATPQERKFNAREISYVARRGEEDGGLRCRESMLFDGGHSTQFYFRGDDKRIRVDGDPVVPVFVIAKRK